MSNFTSKFSGRNFPFPVMTVKVERLSDKRDSRGMDRATRIAEVPGCNPTGIPSSHVVCWALNCLQSNRMFSCEQHCNIVPQYCNFDRQIAQSKLQPTRKNCKLEIHKRFVNN